MDDNGTRRWASVGDAAVAVALFALVCAESSIPGRFPGPTWAWLASAAVATLPLAVRRRAPLPVLAVGSAAIVAEALAVGVPQSAGLFLASLLATYSTALHAGPRARAAGVLVLVVALPTYLSRDPTTVTLLQALPTVALQSGAWSAGAVVRRRVERTAAAQQRAEVAADAVARAAEQERVRIAHELHDVVAHGLSVMVVQASSARLAAERGDPIAADALRAVEATGREALSEMRRLLGVLRPQGDDQEHAPAPGLADLPSLVERVRAAGVAVDLSPDLPAQLPPALQATLYRIVQEALTNVVKHAGPTTASVTLALQGDDVVLRVADDGRAGGRPLPAPLTSTGRGHVGMRERAAAFGGSVTMGQRAGRGFEVEARLPVPAASGASRTASTLRAEPAMGSGS